MNLTVELVRETMTGSSKKLDLITSAPGNSLEDALFKLVTGIKSDLSKTTAKHPDPSDPYSVRIAAYDATLKATYKETTAKKHDVDYDVPATEATAKFGPLETSIYLPGTSGWTKIDGRNYALALLSTDTDEDKLIGKHTYYVQIRPESLEAECEYLISTAGVSHFVTGPTFLPQSQSIKGVALFLYHTRTEVVSFKTSGQAQVSAKDAVAGSNVYDLRGPFEYAPEGTGDFVRIRIRFKGDPVHVRAATLLVPGPDRIGPVPVWPGGCAPLPLPPAVLPLGSDTELTKEWLFSFAVRRTDEHELRSCIVRSEKPKDRAKQFFRDLDEMSFPPDGSVPFRDLGALLSQHYMARGADVHGGGTGAIPTSPDDLALVKPQLALARDEVYKLLKKRFPAKPGEIDFVAIERAFLRFARGELTAHGTHGAPNGVNMFAFAELARFCVDLGVKPKKWRRLFAIFAKASEVFVGAYHATGGPRTICAYRVEFNPEGVRGPSETQKAKLDTDWDAADPFERFSQLVHFALYDEFDPDHEPKPYVAVDDYGPAGPI